MRFSAALLSSLAAAVAYAQSTANPFKVPTGGYVNVSAGQPLTLAWTPTTGGTVSLVLRSGPSSNLAPGTLIVANALNSGSYTWTVPSSITKGSNYAVEIIADSDTSETNYTPPFPIDSTNTVASSTGVVTIGSSTAASSATSAASSASSSAKTSASASSTASASASSSSAASSAAVSTAAATHTGAAVASKAVPAGGLLAALAAAFIGFA